MRKQYWKHFAAAIAALSAAATLLTALFKLDFVKENWIIGVVGALLIVAGSFAYAWWQVRSKKTIILNLSSELKLTVQESDLFQQKGVICIPFNEYFDTHVGDGVVDKDSLHGFFINKYFSDRIEELRRKIDAELHGKPCEEHARRVQGCPTKKYGLGTCVSIRDGENTYVLFALTHFDDNDKANVNRSEYTVVVDKLMKYLGEKVENREVHMPLFGTGLSRLNRTPQRTLLHLVDTLDFNESYSIPQGVYVHIKSLDKVSVNLNTVEYIVKQGIVEKES